MKGRPKALQVTYTGWRSAGNSDSSSPAYCSRFLFTVQDMFFADSISSAGTKAEQRTKSWRTFSVCPHFCQPACCTPYSVPGSENGRPVKFPVWRVNRIVYCKRLLNFICLPQSIIQSLRSKACWILSQRGSNCRKCVHCSMSNKTQLKYEHYERTTETCKNSQQTTTTTRVHAAVAKSNKIPQLSYYHFRHGLPETARRKLS